MANGPAPPVPQAQAPTSNAFQPQSHDPLDVSPFDPATAPAEIEHKDAKLPLPILPNIKTQAQDSGGLWGISKGSQDGHLGVAAYLPGLLSMGSGRVVSAFEKAWRKLTQPQSAGQLHGIGGAQVGGGTTIDAKVEASSVGAPSAAGTPISAPPAAAASGGAAPAAVTVPPDIGAALASAGVAPAAPSSAGGGSSTSFASSVRSSSGGSSKRRK